MDVRTILAAVLGVGLGLVLVVFPDAVVQAQTAGRLPHDRRGDYGSSSAVPARWRHLVRIVGGLLVLGGIYFATRAVGVL